MRRRHRSTAPSDDATSHPTAAPGRASTVQRQARAPSTPEPCASPAFERLPFLDAICLSAGDPVVQRKSRERDHIPDGPVTEVISPRHYRIWSFVVDSAELPPAAVATVGQIAFECHRQQHLEVAIVGHTSGSGSERHNDRLSFTRATRLRDMLVEHGVELHRLTTVFGAGESEPLVAEHDDPAQMARNRRVEVYLQGPDLDDPVGQLHADAPARTPDEPTGSSKGIGCADLREQLKWLLVEKEAWNQYYQRGPRSHSSGIRDQGGDGSTIAPDRVGIEIAAKLHGYGEVKDWDFFEGFIKLSATRNLNAHLMEINRSIDTYRGMLQGNAGCDPKMPKILGIPDDKPRRKDDFPQAGDTAPGGQKY